LAAATPAAAQGPPAGGPPPDARFDTDPVRFDVDNLNLPPGFGVGAGPGRPFGELPVAGSAGPPPTATGTVPQRPPGSGGFTGLLAGRPAAPSRLLPGARLNVGSSGLRREQPELADRVRRGRRGTTAAFGTATTGAGATAGVVAAPARWSGPLTFVAADPAPPARLPAGARFGSGGVSFGESDVSPGRVSNVNLRRIARPLSAASGRLRRPPTDLGGMSVQAEGGGLRFTLGTDILFDFNKFDLRAEADPILRKLVEQVRAEVPSRAATWSRATPTRRAPTSTTSAYPTAGPSRCGTGS
jgi:hypothetical protein